MALFKIPLLGERSEAHSHKDTSKWVRFFPVCDIPPRLISLNVNFSAPFGQIDPVFVWTLRRVHDLLCSKVSAIVTFFSVLPAIKTSVLVFFRGQRVSYWVLTLQEANVFALKDGAPISWAAWCDFLITFLRPVFSKKKSEIFKVSPNGCAIPHCTLRFSNLTFIVCQHIRRTHLFVVLLHWQRRSSAVRNVLADESFFVNEFSPKLIKNLVVFWRQVHFAGLIYAIYIILMLSEPWNMKRCLYSVFSRKVFDFLQVSGWYFLNRNSFQMKLCIIWSMALQSDPYYLKWATV